MDLAGFRIAEAAAGQLEATATKPAADGFWPGGKDSTVDSAGAAVAQGSFDTVLAHSLVEKQKWDDLLTYLSRFMDLNDHPGLKFFILERQFLEHAQAKRGDAMRLVLRQVVALCAREEAIDFIPADLSDRAAKLSERALQMNKQSTFRGVENDEESDLATAICDYMRLYFPTTIRPDNKKWKGTLILSHLQGQHSCSEL